MCAQDQGLNAFQCIVHCTCVAEC